jgi:hypothetical protein
MSLVNGPSPSARGGGDIMVSSKADVPITKKEQINTEAAKISIKDLNLT